MPSIDLSRFKTPKPTQKPKSPGSLLAFLNQDLSFGSKNLSEKKKEAFYLELSTLLQSGIDLKTSLELILVDQTKEKLLFDRIKQDVLTGMPLSEAIKSSSRFSDYEYHTIRIGEETGQLGTVLFELATYYKSKIAQRRKIISAVTYPAIVLMTSMGAVLFMINFVVPMFADVFIRFGGELPWITALIIKISKFMDKTFFYLLGILFLGIIFFIFNKDKLWFRKTSARMVLRLPLVGDLVRKVYLARFANTMRLLVSADIPLLRSLGLVRQMIQFYPIESSLLQIEQDLLKGISLHNSMAGFKFYPPKLVQLIKVGEEVNRLAYFFEKISNQYTEEVEYKTSTIASLMEPLIIIFLGLVVGVILIAMYLPMFQMSNSF